MKPGVLSYAAPMYIVMVMKPSGAATLNRMLSFVVGHLALFAPGADVPKFPDIVEGMAIRATGSTRRIRLSRRRFSMRERA